jgi:hypothetical protein
MKVVRCALIILLLLGVAACRQDEVPEEIGGSGGTFVPILSPPQPVMLDELAEAPGAYLNQQIQLTGRYEPVRPLVCINEVTRNSPATWSISDGNLVAQVGGFDEQVKELLPPGLTVTVNGVWRFWEGRVGCGKQAEITQVWYLEATTIVSPSPLVRLTLTPSGDLPGGQTAAPPELTPSPTPATPLPPSPTDLPAAQPTQTPAPSPTVPTTVPTTIPTLTASPTVPAGASVTATPAISLTVTPTETKPAETPDGTPTATANNTTTPTATRAGTATATPNADNIIVQGNINSQSLVADTLTAGVGHQYNFEVNAGEIISISLVMVNDNNPTFQLVDPDGDVIAQQDEGLGGETEHLIAFSITETGQYAIVIREVEGDPAEYAMTMGKNSDAFVLVFNDPLFYGQTGRTFIKPSHLHYWHFYGEAGDEITIVVEPLGDADMAFRVRDPFLQFLNEDYTNEGIGGDAEEDTFILPVSGLYTIDVEEWDFESGDYQIEITER